MWISIPHSTFQCTVAKIGIRHSTKKKIKNKNKNTLTSFLNFCLIVSSSILYTDSLSSLVKNKKVLAVKLSEVLLPESVAAVSQVVRVRVRQVLQAVDGSVVGAGAEELAGVLVEGAFV